MIFAIDMDGVITSNPHFWSFFTYQLKKKENNNSILILSARNPRRYEETKKELKLWNIKFDGLIAMFPTDKRDLKSQAQWKMKQIKIYKPDLWFDNDFKIYKQAFGIDMWKKFPKTTLILI